MNYSNYLKQKFSIIIKDEQIVEQALTHPSYANEILHNEEHYERLEFIGDAILQFLISQFLYKEFPKMNEGQMTVLRAKAVREESLANYSKEYELYKYIKVGKGEKRAGGALKSSVMSNVFESMLGAIYISNGLEDASVFVQIVYDAVVKDDFDDIEDFKTKLQEFAQADSKRTVMYELIKVSGSANEPVFEFKVLMNDLTLGYGKGTSKKKAQQCAAKDALQKLAVTIKEEN
ncbi:ribonuclease III [Mycoplasma sp. P36-A1]|uniref:ribonuclease III n=1 Tax=Mycoplasma sp. P36-A1 TaxID=3252900 RepID=UPI003C304905